MLTETPGVSLTEELYDIDKPSDGFMVKFYLPVALAALGLIEFFVTSGLLIYVCLKTPRVITHDYAGSSSSFLSIFRPFLFPFLFLFITVSKVFYYDYP